MKENPDFLAVGLSPAIQKTVIFKNFREGEVNRSERYYIDAAGKCINVCRVLMQGGMDVSCLTIAGTENRVEFEALCVRDELNILTIETSGRVRTCTTIVNLEKNNSTELVVNEPEIITGSEEEAFKSSFQRKIDEGFRCIIISGSRAKGFSNEIIPLMVKDSIERGRLVIADFRGEDLKRSFISHSIRPDYIKINEEEFYETFPEYPSLKEGLSKISNEYNCAFIITRGALSTIAAQKGEVFEIDSRLIDAVNPIGCGDSMTAGLAQGILEGLSLKEAVEKGRDYATRNALSIHPGWILESK